MEDKGKHSIQSLPHPVPQDKRRQIDCSGVAMDCEKQLSLEIYKEDPSKQNSLSVLEMMVSQDINDFSFSVVTFVSR